MAYNIDNLDLTYLEMLKDLIFDSQPKYVMLLYNLKMLIVRW